MNADGDAGAAGVEPAARMLALAQQLHDEHVAEGQKARERLIREGQAKYDEFVSAGKAKRDELIAEGETRVAEAQQKRAEVLQRLDSERSVLQKEIEELRIFEHDHRTLLKSYFEGELIKLEQSGKDETV
jgi:hypothetical protein